MIKDEQLQGIIANNIVYYRKQLELTQSQLAEKTGITEVTISRYVSSERVPKATEIVKIATALNCSCDYLLGLQDELSKETEMETAIHNLKVLRTFLDDKWKNSIDIVIQAIEKQKENAMELIN